MPGADDERRILIEVEEATGPGVELEPVGPRGGGLVARRARRGGVWLGLDRAVIIESDDGRGRALRVLVAVPGSTFAGCRIEARLWGALQAAQESLLVATVAGHTPPAEPIIRAAAGLPPEAVWIGAEPAARIAHEARVAYRERSSHARLSGGKAWRTPEGLSPEAARWNTPFSRAEYRVDQLPPRYVRGLEGLLDDDERLLYAIERPPDPEAGFLRRLRHPEDRRSALLALTDRQLIWMVDHADPGRYLMDWGVDIDLVPVERLDSSRLEGLLRTLPTELGQEAEVLRGLADRFLPAGEGSSAVRRRYPAEPQPIDPDEAGPFSQAEEAQALAARLAQEIGPLLAFLYSPRRPGQTWSGGVGLGQEAVALARGDRVTRVALGQLRAVRLVLSPLVGRLQLDQATGGTGGRLELAYPAPFAATGAGLVRRLRRRWADAV